MIANRYRKRGSQIFEESQVLKMYVCGPSIDALLNISMNFFIPSERNFYICAILAHYVLFMHR